MREILHISDIHFGPHHAPEMAGAVLGLVRRRRPDLVVISGDLTQRAKPEQFREARDFVDRLEAPSLVVPGNHDVPLYRFWERILTPFGAYRRHFSTELEPIYRDDELFVVGVNTAFNWTHKDGRISRSRLTEIAQGLREAPVGSTRIVVAHHQLVPAPRYDDQRVLRNAYEAVDVFSRHGVELVLSGHLHQAYVVPSEAYYPTGRRPFLLVHAGTTTSHRGRGSEHRRYTCNWIRIGDDELAVSHLAWDETAGEFLCQSRHQYPRRREPYALDKTTARDASGPSAQSLVESA